MRRPPTASRSPGSRPGAGPPLVWMPSLGNLVAQWRIPFLRRAYEALAGSLQLVLYDGRGTGSSSRQVDPDDLGVDAQLRDLDAVVAAAGLEHYAVLGYYHSVPAALAHAAAHPDRVTRMVLFGGSARTRDVMSPSQTQALALPRRAGLGPLRRVGGARVARLAGGRGGAPARGVVPDRRQPDRGDGDVPRGGADRRPRAAAVGPDADPRGPSAVGPPDAAGGLGRPGRCAPGRPARPAAGRPSRPLPGGRCRPTSSWWRGSSPTGRCSSRPPPSPRPTAAA